MTYRGPTSARMAAWAIVNLIRQFCDSFEVVVPSKAHSAGTLICLGAESIVMTKQATLGPIDPSVNTPLNPQIQGGPPNARTPVSVEAINGFIELARQELHIRWSSNKARVLSELSAKVHPLVLGEVYRARGQIKMLARRLLTNHVRDRKQQRKIIAFLCSESGSHDYTINRIEAKDELGLKVEKPDDELYGLIKRIYDDVRAELELTQKFDPNTLLGGNNQCGYLLERGLIESVDGGSDMFVSEGTLSRVTAQPKPGVTQVMVKDDRSFEGWRHF